MWHSIADWGLGMKDEIAKDEDLWQLLSKTYSAVERGDTKKKLIDSKGEAAVLVFFIPSESVFVEPEYFMQP